MKLLQRLFKQEPSRLVRWETPFTDLFFPSITSTFVADIGGKKPSLKLAICNDIRTYPKHLVFFEHVLVFNSFDESCAPVREDLPFPHGVVGHPSAWQWFNSPWIESYQGCNMGPEGPDELLHYLILGGDSIVEIIAKQAPVIDVISEPGSLTMDFHF